MSQSVDPYEVFEKKKAVLCEEIKSASGVVGLNKSSSNLFRHRTSDKKKKINVKHFNKVLHVDPIELIADIEGMAPYDEIVNETLKLNCLPTVVPELKSITIGGALTGVGIESSSFKFGLVHETVLEIEVLLSDGSVVIARPDNEFRDLFFGFPNSYGTLGYALRIKVRLVPVKPFVRLEYQKFSDIAEYFAELNALCLKSRSDSLVNFIDGVVFSENELYIIKGSFVDVAPYTNDYSYMKMFFSSVKERSQDFLKVNDYVWRWDTDWFWCSKHFGVQNKFLRFFMKPFLNSRSYWKLRHFANKLKLHHFSPHKTESVVQDVELPINNASEFLRFLLSDIKVLPIWICPLMAYDPKARFDLYYFDPLTLFVNFGFWDVVPSSLEEGHFNRLIEKKVEELDGKKSLYSDSFYSESEFWQLYNKPVYDVLKKKYDSQSKLSTTFEKCVKRG